MIKRAIACLLFVMLAMLIPLQLANAQLHHIAGTDPSYQVSHDNNWNVYPCYSECNHDVWPGDSENTEVGMGVAAKYVTSDGEPRQFDQGWWLFNVECGDGDVAWLPGFSIDPCVNGNNNMWYSYNAQFSWKEVIAPGWDYWCWYTVNEINPNLTFVYIGSVNSVEGQCNSAFYHPSDPPYYPDWGPIWWLNCQTQDPSNHGTDYNFLTAYG